MEPRDRDWTTGKDAADVLLVRPSYERQNIASHIYDPSVQPDPDSDRYQRYIPRDAADYDPEELILSVCGQIATYPEGLEPLADRGIHHRCGNCRRLYKARR